MTVRPTDTSLNAICPYFTMFPLVFPRRILQRYAKKHQAVLDPFCGRGTTNFAARLEGLRSLGVDSSPVATAITQAKLAQVGIPEILSEARYILSGTKFCDIPSEPFWGWAYHPEVLVDLCRFRSAFLRDCSTPARIALRGIILGALHGPRQKTFQSHFSNQSPRTYAPKPDYAIRYWRSRDLRPLRVDALGIIERRARRYYGSLPKSGGEVRLLDSRVTGSLKPKSGEPGFSWVITSPPYYGMRTYITDQWLRYWFLGGASYVDYTNDHQVLHSNPQDYVSDIRRVWNNVADSCKPDAKMVVRFGGISSRPDDPLDLIKNSFRNSRWRLSTIKDAGTALEGKRQADAFLRSRSESVVEYDLWASLA